MLFSACSSLQSIVQAHCVDCTNTHTDKYTKRIWQTYVGQLNRRAHEFNGTSLWPVAAQRARCEALLEINDSLEILMMNYRKKPTTGSMLAFLVQQYARGKHFVAAHETQTPLFSNCSHRRQVIPITGTEEMLRTLHTSKHLYALSLT